MEKIRPLEIFLVQLVIYILLWLGDDYLATMVSLIFGTIFFLILFVSLIVEWIERSKVPIWYYKVMAVSILAPLSAALIYLAFSGELDWMRG